MSVRTTHTLMIRVPHVNGVSIQQAYTGTGQDQHICSQTTVSAEECKAALAQWLRVLTAAVERELA